MFKRRKLFPDGEGIGHWSLEEILDRKTRDMPYRQVGDTVDEWGSSGSLTLPIDCLLNQNWTSPKLETTSRPFYNLHSSPQEQAETSTEKLFCLLSENLPKPHIQIRNKTVPERHFVALACVSENPRVSIRWTFNKERMKATDRRVLSWDNRRLIIGPITKKDTGAYQCEVSNTFISRLSDPVSLGVLCEWPKFSPSTSCRGLLKFFFLF